jgi:hypothetical protein
LVFCHSIRPRTKRKANFWRNWLVLEDHFCACRLLLFNLMSNPRLFSAICIPGWGEQSSHTLSYTFLRDRYCSTVACGLSTFIHCLTCRYLYFYDLWPHRWHVHKNLQ